MNLSHVGRVDAAREAEVGTAGAWWIFEAEVKATIRSTMKEVLIIILYL